MSKSVSSKVLPICMKNEMYDYIDNLVVNGRYESKAEFVKKAIYEKMRRDKKNRFVCDFCHRKFKKLADLDISIEHTSEGIAVRKIHKSCSKKSSVFEGIFEGVKVSA